MRVLSEKEDPIKDQWYKPSESVVGTIKEVLGGKSLFRRHCQTRMRRVIKYQKTHEGVAKIGCRSWLCEVCGRRAYCSTDL